MSEILRKQTKPMSENLPKCLSFSGGQTSGYMLRREIDKIGIEEYNRTFTTLFCNTGKEHDKTLDFVHEVETRWGVNVVWLEYTRVPATSVDSSLIAEGRKRTNHEKAQSEGEDCHWFKVVDYETAARRFDKVTPFDVMLEWAGTIPNVRTRQCSVQLKLRTMQRWIRANLSFDYQSHIGIRTDEAHRKIEILANLENGEHVDFPLIDSGVDKNQVDAFWDANDFKLNIPNYMGNCDLCFLKAKWKRLAAARAEPEAAQWWSDWEDRFRQKTHGDGATFIKGKTYAGLISEATHPELALDFTEQDIPCSCEVGGYRHKDHDDD